jgi:alkylation response protein AidB-like acyl-CoA dehydrogenase
LDFDVFRSAELTWPSGVGELRRSVREFLAAERERGTYQPQCNAWAEAHDPGFSRRLGERGWIGMTWPRRYGGGERSALERFVLVEELVASGAPVSAHWFAERQSAPSILRFGTEDQKQRFVSAIARGECFFAIGLSEPGAGSDLAAVSTRATQVEGGWRVNGSKIWTSHAHKNHYILALVRTGARGESRHAGLTQFIIDLRSAGLDIRPIATMDGAQNFCELHFEDVFVPDDQVLGTPGDGWSQVTAELTNERSGPERFLSSFALLRELWDRDPAARRHPDMAGAIARLWSLRQMSRSVAWCMEKGLSPAIEAALVKDEGTVFETDLLEVCRRAADGGGGLRAMTELALLGSPGFTIRGGTNEVLRGIVAKGLGAR